MKKLIVSILLLAVTGCSGPTGDALRVGNGTEPQGLDPHTVTGVPEHRLLCTLFEGLVDADPADLHPIPAVAESWEISDDGTVYTFHLRDTAMWSNGDPVTADDFVYAWQRILSPGIASEYSYLLHCMKNAKAFNEGRVTDFAEVGAKALDARTLEVTLDDPVSYFLAMQIHYVWFPVHRPTIERFGRMDERGTKWTHPPNLVGNGAYALERWVPNSIIEVVKNERYWNAATVRLKRILFYPIDNVLSEERSFRTGQLHLTENAPISKVPVYRRDHPELLRIDPYLGIYYYRVNVTRPPFDDVRVRRAFAMAIDRETLVTRVLTGGQLAAYAYTVPGMAGYTCRARIEYDVEEARRLLGEAGYPGGAGLPPIDVHYNTSENHKLIAEAIQRMWKVNLGADVSLLNEDWKVYLDTQNNLDYQVSRAGWIGDYADPSNFLDCFLSSSGNNRTGWASQAYDDLMAQAARTPDTTERNELFQKAEAILLEEAPVMPIYIYTRVYLKSPEVKGWKSNLLGYISFKDLWLE